MVQAYIKAAVAEGAAGVVFNVACGERTSLNQILDDLRKVTEVDVDLEYGPDRPGDVKHSLADISKAREILDYNPAVSAQEGLRRSVTWYRTARKQ